MLQNDTITNTLMTSRLRAAPTSIHEIIATATT